MNVDTRQQFLRDYAIIRAAEHRGSDSPEYYRALPDRDLSGLSCEQWRIRGRSYRFFERKILGPLESNMRRPLRILDLGAGNGWMSHRLWERGHYSIALDIFSDAMDGLGAIRHYPFPIPALTAEFDALPIAAHSMDVAIYNSSFHYSVNYSRTLEEIRRCLRPGGLVVIMDTPLYRRREHGERMREERHDHFARTYGFRSDAVGSVEFLDRDALASLQRDLSLDLHCHKPWYGWRWAMRPLRARLAGKRPPSQFVILAGRFREA